MFFNPKEVKDDIIQWIRSYFDENGKGCNAIVGISGGKDSSIVAALCVEALGKDRVIGVMMPQGIQSDISDSHKLIEHLQIEGCLINIGGAVMAILNEMRDGRLITSRNTRVNLPARIRMSTLFAISQTYNGRVANTCNLSEDWVGYSTLFGDSVGQFSPLANLTVTEVKSIGYELGLPAELIDKVPADGLSGKTDESNLGFTYEILDKYIRTGVCEDFDIKKKIDDLHKNNLFKLEPMPTFPYGSVAI